jgi:hypothetical protein
MMTTKLAAQPSGTKQIHSEKGLARSIPAPVEKNITSKADLGVPSPLHEVVYLWPTLPALQIRAAVVLG